MVRRRLLVSTALAVILGACGTGGARPSATAPAGASPTAARATASVTLVPRPSPTGVPTLTTGSGVVGIVLAGPTCPVERVDSPCPERPASMPLAIYAGQPDGGEPVATVTSGLDGRFRLALRAGTYTVQRAPCGPQNCSSFPILRPVSFDVRPGAYTELTLDADTGIR